MMIFYDVLLISVLEFNLSNSSSDNGNFVSSERILRFEPFSRSTSRSTSRFSTS